MRKSIASAILTSPSQRQARHPYRFGRDARLVNAFLHPKNDLSVSYSAIDCCTPSTALASGTVLLDGRVYCSNRDDIAGIVYDPVADTIVSATRESGDKNQGGFAVLIPSGKVLIAPFNTVDNSNAQFRIYDPILNSTTRVGSLYANFAYSGGETMMPSGKVFVSPYSGAARAIAYDPIANSSIELPMPYDPNSGSYGATLLLDGRVLSFSLNTNNMYLFDSLSMSYQSVAAPTPYTAGQCLMPDGRVFIIDDRGLGYNWIYDPIANSFSAIYASPVSTSGCKLMPDGRIIINSFAGNSVYIYDPDANSYQTVALNGLYRNSLVLPDGRIMLIPRYNDPSRFAFLGKKGASNLLARSTSPFYNKW